MVAPGQNAGAGGGAEGGGVHVVITEAILSKCVNVGRVDGAAVTTNLAKAGIVKNDE